MISVAPINEVDLDHLALDELLTLIADDLYDGQSDLIFEDVNEALRRGLAPTDILNNGLVAGMGLVSDDFRAGILFVPHVLKAARALQAGIAVVQPHLPELAKKEVSIAAEDDIQEVGQKLVEMLIRPNGFDSAQVVDIMLKWPGVDLVESGTYVWASGL